MTKNQKTLLGVGVLAVAGYLVWKSQQKKSFANLTAPKCLSTEDPGCGCPPKNGTQPIGTANDGTTLYPNGHTCCGTKLGPCPPGSKKATFVGEKKNFSLTF